MTDLQERLARALGWTYIQAANTWGPPDGPYRNAAVDWPIVPLILAECERLGWDWQMGRTTGFPGGKISHWAVIRNSTMPMPMGDGDTPPEALAEAFCRAREANDRPD